MNAVDPSEDAAPTPDFPRQLRAWRRQQMLKQEAVAAMLGVTQAAVSRWENGLDEPTPHHLARLRGLMAARLRDDLAVERALLSRLPGKRALFELDGVRLVGLSRDLLSHWPGYASMMGRMLQDRAIGEMRGILDDRALMRDIRTGQIAMISGTSIENLRFQRKPEKHRWHLTFRQAGRHMIADMTYDTCPPEAAVGVQDILRIDGI